MLKRLSFLSCLGIVAGIIIAVAVVFGR